MKGLLIAVGEDFYIANRAKIRSVLLKVWSDERDENWCDSGWVRMRQKNDHAKIWLLYPVTDMQIKDVDTDIFTTNTSKENT